MSNAWGPPKIELITKKFMIDKAISNSRSFEIFHPSAWGSCLRKIAYQYYNEEEKFFVKSAAEGDLKLERIFDNGHGIHARWQNYLDCAGVLRGNWKCANPECGIVHGLEFALGIFNPIRAQKNWRCACGNSKKLIYEELTVKSPEEYNFEGHCDAVVDLRGTPYECGNDLDLMVVDFKSMKDEQFFALDHAKHEHIIQVHIYMWILGIPAGVVLYENKDSQAIKEMFVPRDEKIITKIKEEALWMRKVLEHKKLPERPSGYSVSKFPCRFCEFAKICYS